MYSLEKRFFDLLFAVLILVLTFPVALAAFIILLFSNRGHVFFLQKRPGLHGKPFHIIKFKTMNDISDKSGKLLPDARRLTRAGRLIRKTSLDELPQLINVLKGDMSFVGPRPLLMEYLPLYSPEQARRHDVRPGITGWAQVNGRNAISWDNKFKLDVWYVDNMSFLLDLKILWLTLFKVIKSEGITQNGHATAEKFRGN